MAGDSCEWDSAAGVERLKAGDAEAWAGVVGGYDNRLRHDIFASLSKRGLAEDSLGDITQETWLAAVRYIHDFAWKGDESLYHWLRVISINQIRRRARRLRHHNPPERLDQLNPSKSQSSWELAQWLLNQGLLAHDNEVEDKIIQQMDAEEIYRAINAVENPLHRQIAILAFIEGYKTQQIADELKVQPATVAQTKWRIRKHLTHDRSDEAGTIEAGEDDADD